MAATVSTIRPIFQLPRPGQAISSMESGIGRQMGLTIVPATEISPAVAMTDDELACFHAAKFVLRSHTQLTDLDRQYAANYISSFYSYSKEQLELNLTKYLNDENLVRFLVYANRRDIGKFALTFNEQLDTAIKNRDDISLRALLLGPKEMFIEVYNNPYLSNEDREFLIRLISREEYAITLTLGQLRKKLLDLEMVDDQCTTEDVLIHAQGDSRVIQLTTLTTKCYGEVCIQDARILSDDSARATMSLYERPSAMVYTVDKPASSVNPRTYCFNTLDLIAAVTENTPINPQSREQFSTAALNMIRQRFRKEIAMYQRYREGKTR